MANYNVYHHNSFSDSLIHLDTFYQVHTMIKSIAIALAMIPNNNQVKMGSHVVVKPDSDSNEAPGIIDKEYDFGKRQWMQDKLFQLQSARISFLDKEDISKEVLELIDLDEAVRIGSNIMAAGLTGDWGFHIQS